jgi:hypothetical protein
LAGSGLNENNGEEINSSITELNFDELADNGQMNDDMGGTVIDELDDNVDITDDMGGIVNISSYLYNLFYEIKYSKFISLISNFICILQRMIKIMSILVYPNAFVNIVVQKCGTMKELKKTVILRYQNFLCVASKGGF